MLSLRAVARSAPRSLARLSSTGIRSTRIAQPSSALRTGWVPLRTQQLAAGFSSTPRPQAAENEASDKALLAKLDSELQFEENLRKENEQLPASIKDFLENSPYELKDEPGKEDVYLVRKLGNETITVSFSISDLNNMDPEQDFRDEDELNDDELTPEDKRLAENEDGESLEGLEDESREPVPCRVNIVVEKPNAGALNIEALASGDAIVVENVYYYKDPKMAHSASADAVHDASDVYPGPPFGSLDEDLQLMMETFLEDRGISQSMSIFIADYMDFKEQREYQAWLKNIRDFVAA